MRAKYGRGRVPTTVADQDEGFTLVPVTADGTTSLNRRLRDYGMVLRNAAEAGSGRRVLFEHQRNEFAAYFRKLGLTELAADDLPEAWYRFKVVLGLLRSSRIKGECKLDSNG